MCCSDSRSEAAVKAWLHHSSLRLAPNRPCMTLVNVFYLYTHCQGFTAVAHTDHLSLHKNNANHSCSPYWPLQFTQEQPVVNEDQGLSRPNSSGFPSPPMQQKSTDKGELVSTPLETEHLKHACFSTWKLLSCVFHACFSTWKLLSCMFQYISCMEATFMHVSCMKHYFNAWSMHEPCMIQNISIALHKMCVTGTPWYHAWNMHEVHIT